MACAQEDDAYLLGLLCSLEDAVDLLLCACCSKNSHHDLSEPEPSCVGDGRLPSHELQVAQSLAPDTSKLPLLFISRHGHSCGMGPYNYDEASWHLRNSAL